MSDYQLYAAWASFVKDLGVSPPELASIQSVKREWCPDGTNDPKRIKEKRPELKRLITELLEGNFDINSYPANWTKKKSFLQLINLAKSKNSIKLDFISWVSKNIGADAVDLISPDHFSELENRFEEVTSYAEDVRKKTISLNQKYLDRKNDLEKRKEIAIRRKRGIGHSRRMNILNRYEKDVLGSMKDALIVLEATHRALMEDLLEMVVNATMASLDGLRILLALPSIEGLIATLEMMPDFNETTEFEDFESGKIASSVQKMMGEFKSTIEQVTTDSGGFSHHIKDIKISLQNDGVINFQQNIISGDGNKIVQAHQTTNIEGKSFE